MRKSERGTRAVAYVDARDTMQRSALQACADARGLVIVEWCEDEAGSDRPIGERFGLHLAMLAIRRAAGVLLVPSHAHLSTDPIVLAAIEGIVERHGGSIVVTSGQAPRRCGADARAMCGVVIALLYGAKSAALRHADAASRRSDGGRIGGATPYGWRFTSAATPRLVHHPREWAVVQFVLAQRRLGFSLARITSMCAEKGFLSRVGKPFGVTQIQRMVEREGSSRGRTIMSTTERELENKGFCPGETATDNAA